MVGNCDRLEHADFGRIVDELSNFEQGKSLSVQYLESCSIGVWKIRILRATQKMEAWLVKFQKEI